MKPLVSRFFKHLICSTTISHFPGHRRIRHRLIESQKCKSSLYFCSEKQRLCWMNTKLATFSTTPASSSVESQTSDSFTAPYLSVNIRCHKNVAGMLSESLLCFGATSTSMDEAEHLQADDEICISSIFPMGQDVKECISHAVDSIGLKEIPSFDITMQEHTDWIKDTQESFNPVEITGKLWIVPEWRKPSDCQATNIILNPGLAFGTGEHPTTKLCLLLLKSLIKGGETFLDYGTGTGILAIAAIKFGAAFSVGLDRDPEAITSARRNAELNNIPPEKLLLKVVPARGDSSIFDGIQGGINRQNLYETCFDVVIANILLNPVVELAETIVSRAKPGATVGVSGIISEQVPCVIERYSQLLDEITVTKIDDWACISGFKK